MEWERIEVEWIPVTSVTSALFYVLKHRFFSSFFFICMHTYVLHGSLYKNGNKRESGVEGHGQKNWMNIKRSVWKKLKFTKGTIKIGENGISSYNRLSVCTALLKRGLIKC